MSSSTSSSSRPPTRDYDTGFPESFVSCTTSLRHPDAIVGPDAAISAEDIDPTRYRGRTRRSIVHKHRRTISHGIVLPETLQQNNESESGSESTDSAIDVGNEKAIMQEGIGRPSKDTDNTSHSNDSAKGIQDRRPPIVVQPESKLKKADQPRRRSFFGKFGRHKH